MRISTFFIAIAAVLVISTTGICCSSFAVYSKQIVYGMNFDYDLFPMKFRIVKSDGVNTFHLSFLRPISKDNQIWVDTAGMNSKGLFGSLQEEYSDLIKPTKPGKNTIFIHQLYDMFGMNEDFSVIRETGKTKKLIQFMNISIHSLFADKDGNAMIFEVGERENRITERMGKFIIMTNFPNYKLKGNYINAKGIGSDRYIAGHRYIEENIENFDISKGMKALEIMKNKNPKYPTCSSMVFDPVSKNIYVSIFTEFDKVFRISLEDSTILTFKGFNKKISFKLDRSGIGLDKLRNL